MLVRYDPIDKPVYEVGPGLKPLGSDLGHGAFDQKHFQIDDLFATSRENKIACLKENPRKYHLVSECTAEIEQTFALFMIQRLPQEYPEHFTLNRNEIRLQLQCHLTKETIELTPEGSFRQFHSQDELLLKSQIQIKTAMDAFALQVQEDFALCRQTEDRDFLCALHVCAPSHWSPAQKIGQSFFQVHAPVPGIEKLNRSANQMVQAMIQKGPFVRFVWSFVTDQRLNHHPEAAPGWDQQEWKGRHFQIDSHPPFYLRIERQTTVGFPQHQFALFTIRISFWGGDEIRANKDRQKNLLGAIHSMSAASRQYKGIESCFQELVDWLEALG